MAKKPTKKAPAKKAAAPKEPKLPKLNEWRIKGDKVLKLNSGNIKITNNGREGTVMINDALAQRLIAKGLGHFLERVKV